MRLDGEVVHYVDEGDGPPLLMLHGNPTWSFLYRELIRGLRDRYRCIALDYPGFGLSAASSSYGYTPAEHARTLERFVEHLDLTETTLMVQDWGGPIGMAVATRHPDRFLAFVVGNTWTWPTSDLSIQVFARILGGPIGGLLIARRNFFVETILARSTASPLPPEVIDHYRRPFPTPASRRPMHVFPSQILASRPWLAEIERDLHMLRDRPALIVWPTKGIAFKDADRARWEQIFPDHDTVMLEGADHYIQEDAPQEIVGAIRDWRA